MNKPAPVNQLIPAESHDGTNEETARAGFVFVLDAIVEAHTAGAAKIRSMRSALQNREEMLLKQEAEVFAKLANQAAVLSEVIAARIAKLQARRPR